MASIIIIAHQDQKGESTIRARFDADFARIGIDNRCTACIADDPKYFVATLRTVTRTMKGFGGSQTPNIMMGTIRWKWLDDDRAHVPHPQLLLHNVGQGPQTISDNVGGDRPCPRI
jgi:hypothetical protein